MIAAIVDPVVQCKLCGSAAALYDVVDFNKSCEDRNRPRLPLSGIPVYYHRCDACGLIFTTHCDGWSPDDFAKRIYNAAYASLDPDFSLRRPQANARIVRRLFPDPAAIDLLDYGGGKGALIAHLADAGFHSLASTDPFHGASVPDGRFHLITCFEVLEHAADPRAAIRAIAGLLADEALVLFSTLLQPPDIDRDRLAWWYAAPRNGHITLFSHRALASAWAAAGLTVRHATRNLHIAYRTLPGFAAHLAEAASWRAALGEPPTAALSRFPRRH